MARTWVWFIPPMPPTRLDALAIKQTNSKNGYSATISIRDVISRRGANCCQVANISQENQGRPDITLGTQKWKGNIPILVTRPLIITAKLKLGSVTNISQVKDKLQPVRLPKIRRPDPKACTIKYLTADSLSEALFWYTSTGKKPIRLISSPAQTPSQWEEEIENIVPNTVIKTNINPKGNLENIRRRMGRTTQNKVSSPVLLKVSPTGLNPRSLRFTRGINQRLK